MIRVYANLLVVRNKGKRQMMVGGGKRMNQVSKNIKIQFNLEKYLFGGKIKKAKDISFFIPR